MKQYSKDELRQIFQRPFEINNWRHTLIDLFNASSILPIPEQVPDTSETEVGYYLGSIKTSDCYEIGLFHYEVNSGSVANKKVGLRNLVRKFINQKYGKFDAALVVFNSGNEWRLSFICDIKGEMTAPKRFSFVFGDPENRYNTPVDRFLTLQQKGVTFANLKETFSVEALSKDFYTDLYAWYLRAVSPELNVTFPNNPDTVDDDRENINVKLIRLITRLLFVWFIKQKKLVPDCLFDTEYLSKILVDFDPKSKTNGNYYNAILQNLFFATLNCAIIDEDGKPRRFAEEKLRDLRNLYRYEEMFSINREGVINLFAKVPFLNGGLFECLDKPKIIYLKQEHDIFYDGFSRNAAKAPNGNYKYRAFVPNCLFFNDDEKEPGLINLLSRYNFTIEENSPTDAVISLDPELLGRVFENLLAAYNPETQESARKSTGSFYTPRIIVDYMVDEALKAHLLQKIQGLDRNALDEFFNDTTQPISFTTEHKKAIIDTLEKIKILDPACGSGAFPMGCLLKIVEIIEQLSDEPVNRYKLKLKIIENCVYGVDIQAIAMLISKLRFFISLICEQTNIDFNSPETNFGINTLPNLETKFVAANSLISADIHRFDSDWTNDEYLLDLKEELLDIRNRHFLAKGVKEKKNFERKDEEKSKEILEYIRSNASAPDEAKIADLTSILKNLKAEARQYDKEVWVDQTRPVSYNLFGVDEDSGSIFRVDINKAKREEYRKRIADTEKMISIERAKGETKGFEAAVKQISEWNPYDQNSVSPFFDPEWMFSVRGGFDIVIGNPPYIQLQDNKGILADIYQPCGFKTFARTGDIYCLFYEHGWNLLRDGGHLCYITSNKWMRSGYGEKLRGFFADYTDPQQLIDFGGVKVFESATVDTNILLFERGANRHATHCAVVKDKNKDSVANLSGFLQQQGQVCDFPSSDSWVILSPIEKSIKRKIEAVGTPLRDWDIQINYGIKTGYNEAFIINTDKRNEILANCADDDERARTADLIRPILRGRDIKRYGYDWADLWLINTHNGIKGKKERIHIEDYPAVKAHLDQYWQKISNRDDQGDTPYNLRNCAYLDDFFKPKVMWKIIGCNINFCFDENNYYCNNAVDIMVGNRDSLIQFVGIMNSKLFEWYLKLTTEAEVQGGGIQLYVTTLEKTLLKLDFPQNLTDIIYQRIENKTTDECVDLAVYDAYGINIEEQQYIESSAKVVTVR